LSEFLDTCFIFQPTLNLIHARLTISIDLIRIVIFSEGATAAMVLGQLGTIEPLNGSNYAQWRERIEMILGHSDLDYALQDAYPTEPSVEDPLYENKHSMTETIRGANPNVPLLRSI
jgi:hypothetical protein